MESFEVGVAGVGVAVEAEVGGDLRQREGRMETNSCEDYEFSRTHVPRRYGNPN